MKRIIKMITAATVFASDIRRTRWGQGVKRKLAFLLLFISFSNMLYAQENRRCGTTEYMQRQMAAAPSLAQQIAANEEAIQRYIASNSNNFNKVNAVITIPVVVHVVYKTAIENISYAQIQSQIDVLNKDYRRLNNDTANTPAVWKNIAADCQIEFCLAKRDDKGNASTGITRTPTTVPFFISNDNVKFTSKGGQDAWNSTMYLNIWICELSNTLAYTRSPGGIAAVDGVTIDYRYFGTIGTATAPYDKGRTGTHEVGHWLNLLHPWGDDLGTCTGNDSVADTPNQSDFSISCPSFPHTDACSPTSPGVMFMNFMDYSDDVCMSMFTTGQLQRITASINLNRPGLKTSQGCLPVCDSTKIMAQFTNTTVNKGSPTVFTNTSFTTIGNIITNNWAFGDGTTSTLQNPTHTYPDSATYTVKLVCTTDFGCSKTIFQKVKVNTPLTISGTESQTIIKNIQFFPNPTTGKLLVNISLQESSDINITIYNMLGESIAVIKDLSSMGDDYTVDLTSRSSGIYFAEIKMGKESILKKIGIVK